MEILVTIAYFFLVRLVFFDYRWLRFTLFWKFVVFGIYALAALTEIVMLGQYAPYSKVMFVQRPVLQMAPEYGGIVKSIPVRPNMQVKQGDVLFEMDPEPHQDKVDQLTPEVALAQRQYDDAFALVKAKVERAVKLDERRDSLESLKAELERAQYNVDHSKIVAPSDGYVVNLQLRPGEFIRLKAPVMTFISTADVAIVALLPQRATQHVKPGNRAQVAFEMYPGRVFEAEVKDLIFAIGNAQFAPSGLLPTEAQIQPAETFVVTLSLVDPDPDHPLEFGASGLATIFAKDAPGVFPLLRRIEIQSEAYLFYLYNPF